MAYLKKGDPVPSKGKGSKLSPKQRAFIDEYMVSQNASEAVLKAGYKTTNQNRIASELLQHPLVSEEIERRLADKQEKTELRADYLVNKLIAIIDSNEERTSDQLKAIELAGKTLALWRERQEITGADGDAIKTEQKVKEDVADFTRSLSRLVKRGGSGGVAEFPKPGSDSTA